jgi:O-antigen ligase
MSVWLYADARISRVRRSHRFTPRVGARRALWLVCLICILAAQGAALTQSDLWAAPLVCLLLVAVAIDLPLIPVIGLSLLVRVLTDDLSSSTSRHSSSVNLSALIAVVLILVAIGLALRRRQAIWPTLLATAWLGIWTAIAIGSHGLSSLTIREGVREGSIVALAVIVFNSRDVLKLSVVTRIVQLAGLPSAFIALYQLATHGGQSIEGHLRAYGTFAQPNSAAVFFAIATMTSLWRYLDTGRRRSDALFVVVYAVATVSTFSLGGLASLLVMIFAYGLLRPGSLRLKLGSCLVAVVIIVSFLATPLGSARLASEASTNVSPGHGTSNSSLSWRFYKWKTLIPEWEKEPLFGQGIGTTTTTEGTSENHTAGFLPHSEVVRYLVETGTAGFVVLVAALAALCVRLSRRRALPDTNQAATFGLALLLGLLVNAVAANTLLYTPAAYATALILAATLCATRVARRDASGRRYDPQRP